MHGLTKCNERTDKVFRVVVYRQERQRISTVLNGLHAAMAKAGISNLEFETRAEAEEALDAIEEHLPANVAAKIAWEDRQRVF